MINYKLFEFLLFYQVLAYFYEDMLSVGALNRGAELTMREADLLKEREEIVSKIAKGWWQAISETKGLPIFKHSIDGRTSGEPQTYNPSSNAATMIDQTMTVACVQPLL